MSGFPFRSRLIFFSMLAVFVGIFLWACRMGSEPATEYRLSLSSAQYDSLKAYDSVVIVVKSPSGAFADTVVNGKIKSLSQIQNLSAPDYRGDLVHIIITGFNGGKAVLQLDKKYDGATSQTTSTDSIILPSSSVNYAGGPITMKTGDTLAIPEITIAPASLADKSVTWSSSDPVVVKIAGSKLVAGKAGTCDITAHLLSDTAKSVVVHLTVTDVTVVPPDTSAPKAPEAPSISSLAPGDGKVVLTWSEVTGSDSYNIYYGEGTSADKSSTRVKGIATPYTVAGLKNGTGYAFALSATNAVGESSLGAVKTATPELPPVSAPIIDSVKTGDGKVTLSWSTVAGAIAYNLYYQPGAAVGKSSQKQAGVSSPYTLTGLANGTQYALALAAVTAAGESGLSNSLTATPMPAALKGLAYAVNPAVFSKGAVATDLPSLTGTADSFTVAPALPAGLSLNKSTGAISGTPSASLAASNFTVTAYNAAGSVTVQVKITVLDPVSGFTYAVNPAVYYVGAPITANTASITGSVDSFTVSPALPAGLSLNKTTGAITGTPTVATAAANYTMTARDGVANPTVALNLTVRIPASGFAYALNPAVYYVGSAITANAASITGSVDSFTVSPALPAGLSLNKSTGAVTGTPTAAAAAANYTVTARDGLANPTVALNITMKVSASGFAYALNPAVYYVGSAITANSVSITGSVDSFTVSPALPAGLSLNKSTGAVTGTPTAAAVAANYTVTARDGLTNPTVALNITVNAAPSALTYPITSANFWVGVPITTATPTVTGIVDSFTVSPALPAGMTINKNTGAISGTPTAAAVSVGYTVTARNKAGPTTQLLTIKVNGAPSTLIYPVTTTNYWVGIAIATDSPSVSGTVDSFTVTPALPGGLSLNKLTGAITGTPTTPGGTSHVVTARNPAGSTTANLSITVNGPPTGLTYTASHANFYLNSVITNDSAKVSGAVDSFKIAPALPAGLSLSKSSGALSGKPTVSMAPTNFVVTAMNKGGQDTETVTLSVYDATAGILKDVTVDTNSGPYNNGYSGAFGLGFWPIANMYSMFQFDLTGVSVTGLKSATAVFQTWGYGSDWTATPSSLKVHVYGLKSSWVEGTGNWYWNAGAWQNSGATIWANYVLPDFVISGSSNPYPPDGVANTERALINPSNYTTYGTQDISVGYPPASRVVNLITGVPGKANLIEVQIDLTNYIKDAVAGTDYGFIVFVEGTSQSKTFSVLTKEMGDGTLGAKLLLSH